MSTENEEPETIYCDRCGAELAEDAVYCSKCGNPLKKDENQVIELATWTQRFIALMIDGMILSVIIGILNLPGYRIFTSIPIKLGIDSVLQFLYFMFMDQVYGQSIGKKVMNLRITKIGGAPLELIDAAIESFGKVFLLPIDFLIGYFMYQDKNQRLFNYLSDTVVIREE